MDFLNIVLGALCSFLGFFLILYYQKLHKENKKGGLSFKIRTAGIGLIIIGLGLIIRELAIN